LRARLPEFRPEWDVDRGIAQLVERFREFGLTHAQFAGREFTRLKQLQHLIESAELDGALQWAGEVRA
jgi:hypothetical protein